MTLSLPSIVCGQVWSQVTLPRYESLLTFVTDTAAVWHPKEFKYKEEYLRWAFSTIISRAWEFGGAPSLVPVADMVNHAQGNTNLVRSHQGGWDDGSYYFKLERDLFEGEQFFQSYDDGSIPGTHGAKCDHQLLSDYGFLPGPETLEESATCVPLSLSLQMEAFPAWKQFLFQQSGVIGAQTGILQGGAPSKVTMATIRLALLDEEPSESDTPPAERFLEAVSPLNELQSLSQLSKMIKLVLDRQSSSVAGDVRALQDPELSTNARLAFRYRVRERRTLQMALDEIKSRKKSIHF